MLECLYFVVSNEQNTFRSFAVCIHTQIRQNIYKPTEESIKTQQINTSQYSYGCYMLLQLYGSGVLFGL
jgi:hypothetical protein